MEIVLAMALLLAVSAATACADDWRVRALADRFREKNHSIICRDLLIDTETASGGEPEARTKDYYERRPCGCYVEDAARLIAEALIP